MHRLLHPHMGSPHASSAYTIITRRFLKYDLSSPHRFVDVIGNELMPKIQIKKVTTWMGPIYRIYIDGR
jgi:hypothetical protein